MSLQADHNDTQSPTQHISSGPSTSRLSSSATPPSTAPMSAQTSQQPSTKLMNPMLTPASSVAGITSVPADDKDLDPDGDSQMLTHLSPEPSSNPLPPANTTDPMQMIADDHRRSDHDRKVGRQADDDNLEHARPEKRARLDGPTEPVTEAIEAAADEAEMSAPGLEATIAAPNSDVPTKSTDLSDPMAARFAADASPSYLLCRTAYTPVRPHPSQDLLSLYNLQALAASVARHDPVTGVKQAMRKTYKGHIKSFGLAGKDKEVRHPEGQPGGLVEMMAWPEEEWQAQKVFGHDVKNGLDQTRLAKLERAVLLQPGPMPKGFDASILGLDNPPLVADPKKTLQQSNGNTRQPSANPVARPAAGVTSTPTEQRPQRDKKRTRRYDDDGYGLDDVDLGGTSSSDREDARRGGTRGKKRKKNPVKGTAASIPMDQGARYGVGGMVGVGTGFGAYSGR